MQSMHFMHPGSTTIPKSRTSSWTRTLEVHTAVQWPQCSQASVTRMRPGEILSMGAKKPPYGQPQMARKGIATDQVAKVSQNSALVNAGVSVGRGGGSPMYGATCSHDVPTR